MTGPAGPQAYRRAQQLAAQADNALTAGDITAAAALAAMAQVHATQANTAAALLAHLRPSPAAEDAWRDALGLTATSGRPVIEGSADPGGSTA